MATIHAWLLSHESGCAGEVRGAECSEGCDWQPLAVTARFVPEPGSSVRDRVLLARMAVLFRGREMVTRERS